VPPENSVSLGVQVVFRPGGEPLVVGKHLDRCRCAHEQVGRVPAGREQPGHPPRDVGVVAQQPQIPRRAAKSLAGLAKRQQARVRPRRVGEPAEQRWQQGPLDRCLPRHARGERLDMPERAGRIDVAERLEAFDGSARRQPDHVARQPGDGVEQRAIEQLLVQPHGHGGVLAPPRDQLVLGAP
jgi:hypothetical protein